MKQALFWFRDKLKGSDEDRSPCNRMLHAVPPLIYGLSLAQTFQSQPEFVDRVPPGNERSMMLQAIRVEWDFYSGRDFWIKCILNN